MDYYIGSDLVNKMHIMSSIEDIVSLCGRHIGRCEFTVSSSLTSLTTLIQQTEGGCLKCIELLVSGDEDIGGIQERYERQLGKKAQK